MPGDSKYSGINIRSLPQASIFYKAGLRKGDIVVAVNGDRISDELEFRYMAAAQFLRLDVIRNGHARIVSAERKPGVFLDVEFHQAAVRRCANKCVFCFIDQMPPGLRRRLYVKDEDLTHSFLNGNYVTLTNAGRTALRRIVSLGLSPLFISVHATDPLVRARMLGIKRAPPIMEQLSFLAKNNIRFHTQIVVCPGYNDGEALAETVKDLFFLGKNLLSIAVVPVGLTRFRKIPLRSVDASLAQELCRTIGVLSDRDRSRHGVRRLFLADELFLRAGAAIPPAAYYEDYPQIENGVGLTRQLLDNWKKAKQRARKPGPRGKKYLLLTSLSAFPFLDAVAREAEGLCPGTHIFTQAVPNGFFGPLVTVAGLLTARDVIHAARHRRFDCALLPAVMFNDAGYTLDGWSAGRLAKEAGVNVKIIRSVGELLDI